MFSFSLPPNTNWKIKLNKSKCEMHSILCPRDFSGRECMLSIGWSQYSKYCRWEKGLFGNLKKVACPLVILFIKLGVCLVALADWQFTQQECDGTEQIVSVRVRLGSRSKSEWHLSLCTSGFRSEASLQATCGIDLGLHAAGLTLPCKKNSHHPTFASGIQLNTSPAG